MGQREGEGTLAQKYDRVLGEQLAAQVQAAHERLGTLQERANHFESQVGHTSSSLSNTGLTVGQLKEELDELRMGQRLHHDEAKRQVSDFQAIMKAVRALTADAQVRCSLDEREMEFLWAAPSQIYGSHGWRPNNGSLSERTPYPVGNFKVAVKHGGEGNAREALNKRKQMLNSISLGRKEVESAEADAMMAGTPDHAYGSPVRLPAVDEIRRRPRETGRHSRPGSGGPHSPQGGQNSLLEPARQLLEAHQFDESDVPGGRPMGLVTPRSARVKRMLEAKEAQRGTSDHWVEAGSRGEGRDRTSVL